MILNCLAIRNNLRGIDSNWKDCANYKKFYDKGLFVNFDNSDEVLHDFSLRPIKIRRV